MLESAHWRAVVINFKRFLVIGRSTEETFAIIQVRMRGTRATDHSLYSLARCCTDLQWISHADQTQRPAFSEAALQMVRDTSTSRVIC